MDVYCDSMEYFSTLNCSEHKSTHESPDVLIAIKNSNYGLIIHDGGASEITIRFCPWCGTNLGA